MVEYLDLSILNHFFPDQNVQVQPYGMGASARKYFQISGPGCRKYGKKTLILTRYPDPDHPSFSDFQKVQRLLKKNKFSVPEILDVHPGSGVMLQENLDAPTLENLGQKETWKNKMLILEEVTRQMARFHQLDCNEAFFKRPYEIGNQVIPPSEIFFNDFAGLVHNTLFKGYFGWSPGTKENNIIFSFYTQISETLKTSTNSLMYRDFQSANLLIKQDKVYFIDFQDMRIGTPYYDLASFFWDAYFPWQAEERERLLNLYFNLNPLKEKDREKFLNFALIQRKWHDAGAFARALKDPAKGHFKKQIKPAIHIALEIMEKYSEFAEAKKILSLVTGISV